MSSFVGTPTTPLDFARNKGSPLKICEYLLFVCFSFILLDLISDFMVIFRRSLILCIIHSLTWFLLNKDLVMRVVLVVWVLWCLDCLMILAHSHFRLFDCKLDWHDASVELQSLHFYRLLFLCLLNLKTSLNLNLA